MAGIEKKYPGYFKIFRKNGFCELAVPITRPDQIPFEDLADIEDEGRLILKIDGREVSAREVHEYFGKEYNGYIPEGPSRAEQDIKKQEEMQKYHQNATSWKPRTFEGSPLSKPRKRRGMPVRCIETGETFDSQGDAAKHFNIDPSWVSWCINKQVSYKGLSFEKVVEN